MLPSKQQPNKIIEYAHYLGRSSASPNKNLSFEIVKNREFESLKEKLRQLYEEFSTKKTIEEVDFQDFINFIIHYVKPKKYNKDFDKSVLSEIFISWDFNKDNKITLNEFYDNYISEYLHAKSKISSLGREIYEIENQVKNATEKYREAKVA